MRRLLVTVAVFLMLAAPVVAAPNPTSNPEFQYVATRVLPNGNEITLEVFDWDGTFADDVVISQVVFSYVRQQRINNPAWVIIVYGPTNGGPHTDDDRIWDSRLQFQMADFYRIVRVRPNGSEQVVRDIPYTDFAAERLVSAEAFVDARTRRDSGQRVRVYTSSGETVSAGDLIWDSAVNTQMAAPSLVQASAGGVGTSTSFGVSLLAIANAIGNLVMFCVMQDGTGAGDWSSSAGNSIESLDGTAGAVTAITAVDVGSPAAAKLHVAFARVTSLALPPSKTFSATDGDDGYHQVFEFTGAHTGTALSDVIENDATTHASAAGTGTTISDVGVVTNGADRLAIQVVGVNDDNVIDAFTGMTGGTWAELAAEFRTATGTDGCIGAQSATMASAGTIDGGSYTMAASDGWGVIGFALKPPATGPAASLVYDPQPLRHLRAR